MDPKQISDTWERGNSYERYIGRWSRQIAPQFLAWLNDTAELKWLDVGCGTGSLCSTIWDRCSPAQVIGLEPSAGFLKAAQENLAGRVRLIQGTATAIPLESGSVDRVVSGLVLNFVPDPPAVLHEMARVTRTGSTIGAYVWDYAEKMELVRLFWDVAIELDPHASPLDEGIRFPLCRPAALHELFHRAGFLGIEVAALEIQTRFTSFADYWQPFLGGQGPCPAYVMSLDEAERARLRDQLRIRLPVQADGSISLIARAWAVRGRVG